jgi:hypothetical protein
MRRVILLGTLAAVALPPAGAGAITGFHSPSGNIGCSILKSGVRCDIRHKDWRSPPKPHTCDFDWGHSINLKRTGKPHFLCISDTTLGLGDTLPYGESIARHRFRCKSLISGVRCVNKRNGHGFKLSRESYRFF